MSYLPGYAPQQIVNPYVFADLSHPMRKRGSVSPVVYQTRPPEISDPQLDRGAWRRRSRRSRLGNYSFGDAGEDFATALFATDPGAATPRAPPASPLQWWERTALGMPVWVLGVGGVMLAGGVAWFVLRRRLPVANRRHRRGRRRR